MACESCHYLSTESSLEVKVLLRIPKTGKEMEGIGYIKLIVEDVIPAGCYSICSNFKGTKSQKNKTYTFKFAHHNSAVASDFFMKMYVKLPYNIFL